MEIRREGTSEAAPEAVRQAVGGGCQGGWGAVTVGYKCHRSRHLASGGRWLGIGWAPWGAGGGGYLPPFQCTPLPQRRRTSPSGGGRGGTRLVPTEIPPRRVSLRGPQESLEGGAGLPKGASEGKGPQRRPQRRLGRRLEEVAEAVGGGYCRLQMPSTLELWVRGIVAGHRLGTVEGVGGATPPPLPAHPCPGGPRSCGECDVLRRTLPVSRRADPVLWSGDSAPA